MQSGVISSRLVLLMLANGLITVKELYVIIKDLMSKRKFYKANNIRDSNFNVRASILDYRKAMAYKENIVIRKARQLFKPLMMLCGPGLY